MTACSPTSRRARLGILLSGSGTTYENIQAACTRGVLPAKVAVVIASRAGVAGITRAEAHSHPVHVAAQADAVTTILNDYSVDWVLMAGWLKFWDPPEQWQGKTLNVHPSLLPAYGGKGMYGQRVHAAVLAAGERHSGCTVHDVCGAYDSGSILAQAKVSVLPGDTAATLGARVQAAERSLYPTVLAHCLRHGKTTPLTVNS